MSPHRSVVVGVITTLALLAIFLTPVAAQDKNDNLGIELISSWFETDDHHRDMAYLRFKVEFADLSFYEKPFTFSFELEAETRPRPADFSRFASRTDFPGIMVSFEPDAVHLGDLRRTYGVMLPLTTVSDQSNLSTTPTLRNASNRDLIEIWGYESSRLSGAHHIVVAVPVNSFMLTSKIELPMGWSALFGIEVENEKGTEIVSSRIADIIKTTPHQKLGADVVDDSFPSTQVESTTHNVINTNYTGVITRPEIPQPSPSNFDFYSGNIFTLALDLRTRCGSETDCPDYVSRITQKLGYGTNLSSYDSDSIRCSVYRITDPDNCPQFNDCKPTAWDEDYSFKSHLTITNRDTLDLTFMPLFKDFSWDGLPRRYICTFLALNSHSIKMMELRDGPQHGIVTTDEDSDGYAPESVSYWTALEAFPSLSRTAVYVKSKDSRRPNNTVTSDLNDVHVSVADSTNPFLGRDDEEYLVLTESQRDYSLHPFDFRHETSNEEPSKTPWWFIGLLMCVTFVAIQVVLCVICWVCTTEKPAPALTPIDAGHTINAGYQPLTDHQPYNQGYPTQPHQQQQQQHVVYPSQPGYPYQQQGGYGGYQSVV